MKKTVLPFGRKFLRSLLYITGILLVLVVAGFFIANRIVHQKLDEALRALPSSVQVRYGSLKANVLTGSLDLKDVNVRYMPDPGQMGGTTNAGQVTVKEIAIKGFSVFAWLRARRVKVRDLRLEDVTLWVDEELIRKDSSLDTLNLPSLDGLIDRVEVTGLKIEGMRKNKKSFSLDGELQLDSVSLDSTGYRSPGAIRLLVADAAYIIPDMDESVRLHHLELDSRKRFARLDSLEVTPNKDKVEIGRLKGHQVDVLQAALEGIEAVDLDVGGLMRHQLEAGQIGLHSSRIYVFRDRRLPLEPGDKPMPMASLEGIPVELRVGKLRIGTTWFEYEEYPKVGEKTGILKIEGLRGTLEPLLNRPRKGDPAFLAFTTEGSLMGSGVVTATTRIPLHPNAFYEVEGAFHDLDVTKLNNPAENLGQLHLESGMLNQLMFQFEMGPERSTGKIVGEYHDLVVDKMKEKGGQLKTDKFKSFALKRFIIPKDKDKSLPVSKRTGKVDYKRDKERYFSYYLLHSLLVGVKSSFSLGFLLPG